MKRYIIKKVRLLAAIFTLPDSLIIIEKNKNGKSRLKNTEKNSEKMPFE